METNFDSIVNRRGTGSLKWDVEEGELPMWVADMDFPAAPCIRRALEARVAHGVFGYNILPDAWAEAYVQWWDRRHGFRMEKDWLIFCTGVVPALSTAVRKLTTPAENVLIQTPVYNIFFNSILNNGRRVLESPLRYEDGCYSIDWEDLEAKLADPQTSLMILCNPHNPTGNIWTREELCRIAELCAAHHVTVLSDEIHCDLTDPGYAYTPFAAASELCRQISVTCVAATKAFNMAGLQSAAVCVPNPLLRHRMWRGLNTDEVAEPNSFAVTAVVAALREGAPWLDELRAYLAENKRLVARFIEAELPMLHLTPSHATYLLWLDISALGWDSESVAAHIRRCTGLYLSAGKAFGGPQDSFLRLNTACPRQILQEGLQRLKEGILSLSSPV